MDEVLDDPWPTRLTLVRADEISTDGDEEVIELDQGNFSIFIFICYRIITLAISRNIRFIGGLENIFHPNTHASFETSEDETDEDEEV